MEFVVPFFSESWPLTLKSSSKCHQMTSFLFKIMKVKCRRKKEPQIPCSSRIFLKSIFWPLKHDFKTETCNFNLSPWILLEPITILLEIYWNPTKVLMEPVGVLLKHSGILIWSSAKSLKIASFCWNILKRSERQIKEIILTRTWLFLLLGILNSFDSSCSFWNLQKYLKIYCEDKLQRVFFLSELFLV